MLTMANVAQSSPSEYLEIPDFEFWIEVAGKRAVQYRVHQDNNVLSCHIASAANQAFCIVSRKHENSVSARARFYLNDDCVKTQLFKNTENTTRRLSYVNTESGKRRFAFSGIDCVDEGSKFIPPLGTIRIDLFRVTNIHRVPEKPEKLNHSPKSCHGLRAKPTMSEKSKSILQASVPSDQTILPLNGFVNVFDYVDPPNGPPWFIVKFFYRPLDILRDQGIIPSILSLLPFNSENSNNQKSGNGSNEITTVDRELLITSEKTSTDKAANKPKTEKGMEIIVVEDSDSEDDKPFRTMYEAKYDGIKTELLFTKRPAEFCVEEPVRRQKRPKSTSDLGPVAIVIDSD